MSIKAKHNYKVADHSERKRYYEVAISRFYYYLYQNIMDYINNKGVEINTINSPNSHYKTIGAFINSVFKNYDLDEEDLQKMYLLQKLRGIRNDADYHNKLWNKTEYETDFKETFMTLNKVIKDKLELW